MQLITEYKYNGISKYKINTNEKTHKIDKKLSRCQ